jgi:glutamine amidotransferase
VITLIDYKAGNIASVVKSFEHLGATLSVTDDPSEIASATALVLPGVGHFAATERLNGLRQVIRDRMTVGVPFLGICVGMQWLFERSTEAPEVPGLRVFAGTVERFPAGAKVPHVGWNTIRPKTTSRLLSGLDAEPFVYYTHSYRCPVVNETSATTEYGAEFSAALERDNVFGVQFHAEKSSDTGLRILRNFLDIAAEANAR